MTRRTVLTASYWLLPFALLGLQALCTLTAMHQIRYEELAESVRNPYWLEHRTIYDGISSNVGWYATVLIAYQLFGFHLFAAKFVRLALHLVSLLCLAKVLRDSLHTHAWLPLLTVGVSPILLYFNTIQTGIGIDLAYAPICIALIVTMRFARLQLEILRTVLCWSLAMVACLSYPSFLVYLPSLALVYGWQCWRHRGRLNAWIVGLPLVALAAFLLPLVTALSYLKDPQLLLRDPVTARGVFRGSGQIEWSLSVLGTSLRRMLADVLTEGRSYYFELADPDLSGILAISSAGFCLVAAAVSFALQPRRRIVLGSAALLLLVSLLLPNLSSHEPGIRRGTGLLAALYVIFAVTWHELCRGRLSRRPLRWVGIAICCLLPIHHAMVYPKNLADLRRPSAFRERSWFELEGSPTESLSFLLDQTSHGGALSCARGGERAYCRYAEIFAALAGSRRWNDHAEIPILAYDYSTGRTISLSVGLWEDYHLPH